MNYLTYEFESTENEGTTRIQSLKAEVAFNRTPVDDEESKCNFSIWVEYPDESGEWSGKPEFDEFDENTAIALRDFLIFCFPMKELKP